MRTCFRTMSAALLGAASVAAPALGQAPLGSGFTYQGSLESSGAVVNATADFEFRLFEALTGGAQIGITQTASNVSVVDGRFTTALDFGAGAFNGNARFLEIAVRSPAGTGDFVVLMPRQRIAPAPYAHKVAGIDAHSLNAPDGDPVDALYVDNIGNVGMGPWSTTPSGRLSVRGTNGIGAWVDSTNGDLHMYGPGGVSKIINDSIGLDARMEVILDNWPQLAINGAGGVGIGTVNPWRRLSVVDGNLWTARFQSSATNYTAVEFATRAPLFDAWTLGVMGSSAGGNAGALFMFPVGASTASVALATNDWVGLGTAPGFRLDLPNIANGDGRARANQWVTFSSARWKENVRTLDGALDKLTRLRGVSFDWKPEHGGRSDVGFIAEEVGEVVPELVTWDENGTAAEGLAYDRVSALAVEAIKEQQRRIERLRQANAELREQIDILREMRAAPDRNVR